MTREKLNVLINGSGHWLTDISMMIENKPARAAQKKSAGSDQEDGFRFNSATEKEELI